MGVLSRSSEASDAISTSLVDIHPPPSDQGELSRNILCSINGVAEVCSGAEPQANTVYGDAPGGLMSHLTGLYVAEGDNFMWNIVMNCQ